MNTARISSFFTRHLHLPENHYHAPGGCSMKSIHSFILAACLAIPALASAQTPAPAADAIGTWNATFNTQQGATPTTLTLQKSGDKITGTLASQDATSNVEAEVKGKTLTVWFNYPSNGQEIPIEMTGTIDGDTAKGTVNAGGNPVGDWTATRVKDTKESKDTKEPGGKVDLTGGWTVNLQLDTINATPTVTFKQDGEKLTGDYVSQQYGKFPLTGTVKGSAVTFSVTLNIEGNSMVGSYVGAVQSDGTIKGSVDYGGMMTGTFTAARKQ